MDCSMRDTDTMHRLLCTVAALAIGTLLSAGPVLADDDDEPVREEGLISNLMKGIGATDGSNGINYRERSPLVVPRNLNLPPPQAKRPEAANWPKDPDVLERRAAREAIKKRDKAKEQDPIYSERIQPEPELGSARARTATVSPQPGVNDDRRSLYEGSGLLTPSQLGVKAGDLFGVFRTKRDDNVPFTGEPTRESLTMPPVGYQTPASNQGYGMTEQEKYKLLGGPPPGSENPSGILPPGKF
jgi:hypothetical protein